MSKQVFVYYPKGARTGGPEALHQLVSELREAGVDASLVPHPETQSEVDVPAYDRYDCPVARVAVDDPDSVIVVPEVYIDLLRNVTQARTVIWWLSIDNNPHFAFERHRSRGMPSQQLLEMRDELRNSPGRLKAWQQRRIIRGSLSLSQSTYAQSYLWLLHQVHSIVVSDYSAPVSEPIAETEVARMGVAYNPSKGEEYTSLVRLALPDLLWIPLEDMSSEEVRAALSACDVYLDLGHHPGKDRLPREAAAAGAVVVVGALGSGALQADVPLHPRFKVPLDRDLELSAQRAGRVLRETLRDRDGSYRAQHGYRRWISGEKTRFAEEVQHFLWALER